MRTHRIARRPRLTSLFGGRNVLAEGLLRATDERCRGEAAEIRAELADIAALTSPAYLAYCASLDAEDDEGAGPCPACGDPAAWNRSWCSTCDAEAPELVPLDTSDAPAATV